MVDLNQCKPWQKLKSKHGMILTYVCKLAKGYYSHKVQYPNGEKVIRVGGDHD